jgi:CRISPR/Cas system CMR-associated protein Cmr5 small subunit
LVWYQKKIASIKIADKGWWYKPSLLYKIASLAAKRYADKYVLASLLAENPERDRIIYDLFCGESTVGFDEIYSIMQSFSPRYFTKLLQDKSDTDPRQAIQRYFELGRAKMMMEQGRKKDALAVIEAIIKDNPSLSEHEKLFMARVYELKAKCSEGAAQQEALNAVYELFPELIPFNGLKMHMALQVSGGENSAISNQVYKALQKTGVEWVEANQDVPAAALYIEKKNNKYEVIIDTRSAKNVPVVLGERIQFETTEGIGEEILMRIFGKKGSIEYAP